MISVKINGFTDEAHFSVNRNLIADSLESRIHSPTTPLRRKGIGFFT